MANAIFEEPVKVPLNLKSAFDEILIPGSAKIGETSSLAEANLRLAEENALLRQRLEHERLTQESMMLFMQLQHQWPRVLPPGPMPIAKGLGKGGKPVSNSNMPRNSSFASTSLPSSFGEAARLSFGSSTTASSASYRGERGSPETDGDEPQTTRMMRNLPNNYTRKMLLNLLNSQGFYARYNLVYLPVDFKTNANLGYAFINLETVEDAQEFTSCFQGWSEWDHASEKVCQVTGSDALQGRDAHIERYRSSPVMHESVADEFKPILFENGERIPFPPPLKKVRAPRQWPRRQ